MQTFLPYADFTKSALCLDYRRLGKQRVESWQILDTLRNNKKAWSNHPAVLMWKNHEYSLCLYSISICNTWRSMGYKDTMLSRFVELIDLIPATKNPSWLGDPKLHASHRSNLLRKDPIHYGKFGWEEPYSMEYVWPVTKIDKESL